MRISALFLSLILLAAVAHAQSETAITYQGQLQDGAQPFDGTAGMEFRLFDSLEGGSQVGTVQTLADVPVTNGLFQVELDFGNVYGAGPLYLEVRIDGQTLVPRERITSTPLAVHALSLDPAYEAEHFWRQDGNAGTTPGTDFLGTTDDTPLEFHVNGGRGLRIEPATNGLSQPAPNVVGGNASNSATGFAVAIGGGENNTGSGGRAVIAGGASNEASELHSSIGGGFGNTAANRYSTVVGGNDNTAGGDYGAIGGGANNSVLARFGTIGGGGWTDASNRGTTSNDIHDEYGTIGGGGDNQAGSDDGDMTSAHFATVGGGHANTASGSWATISGGDGNTASRSLATVGGGLNNTASEEFATVGGGWGNIASGVYASIAGGQFNTASGVHSAIGGGWSNVAEAPRATVGGGIGNSASGSVATIGGGENNTAGGYGATVPGGSLNEAAGDYSLAAGRRAKANHGGAFVWADSVFEDFVSTGTRQFLIRASGGMGINTNSPDRDLHIKQRSTTNSEIGLQIESSDSTNNWAFYIATSDNLGFRYNDTLKSRINASDGAFVAISDANAKRSIEPLSGVLDKVLQLKPRSYLMKDAAAKQSRSTGLIAQEVEALFPDTVSVQDGLYGIKYSEITVLNTAALIELNERYSDRIADLGSESAERFAALESENAELRARVAVLLAEKRQMQALADRNRALEDRLTRLESLVIEQQEIAER